jgi:hypothetical protein
MSWPGESSQPLLGARSQRMLRTGLSLNGGVAAEGFVP